MRKPATDRERLEAIWAIIERIPAGCVCSYGEVARRAGIPRGARQTARALRLVPDERELPWFRVINAQGRISLPPGSKGAREQRRRLEAEGVKFRKGRVEQQFWWSDDPLDELLWGPSET